ncbi:MAG: DnaJ domain-containing protein [Burkholderiaceae bacterium]|nr:DnaJ domain-containing protein [Burkholderiaceae bacterium]
MEFKDYYATLGVPRTAKQDEIKRAYRKLARKYHPDVSKEPDAEARFKEVAEAHEALIDTDRRAAYDDIAQRNASGQPFEPPPGWDSGYEYSGRGPGGKPGRHPRADAGGAGDAGDFSDFFESLFGRGGFDRAEGLHRRSEGHRTTGPFPGRDHHAKVAIGLLDAYQGAKRMISLRMPVVDAAGQTTLQERQLEVNISKGVREGQHLRLSGQGASGQGGAPSGDLYLEIQILPHPLFRLDGSDITFDLPVAPWEAALGATVTAPTPDGSVQLSVPPGSSQGRKLRLKGKGLPGKVPGDLYAVLTIALPPSASEPEQEAWRGLARAFAAYNPRASLEA